MELELCLVKWNEDYIGFRGKTIIDDEEYESSLIYLAHTPQEAIHKLIKIMKEIEINKLQELDVDNYTITNDGLNEESFEIIKSTFDRLMREAA